MEPKKDCAPGAPAPGPAGSSRRSFLRGMGLAAGAAGLLGAPSVGAQEAAPAEPAVNGLRLLGRAPRAITLRVNGEARTVQAEPRTTLLDALREQLGVTGPKEVCSRGSCGCCTVLLDGVAVNSCMTLALDAVGREVTTVEGIARDSRYAAMLQAFYEHDGAQCGFCIPGFVTRSAELMAANPAMTPEEIREGLAGNLCRCGTYSKIFESLEAASQGGAK